jgi:hypothetical protein
MARPKRQVRRQQYSVSSAEIAAYAIERVACLTCGAEPGEECTAVTVLRITGGHAGARARTVPGNRYDYGARGQTTPGRCWHARRGPEPAFALATAGSKSASCPGFTAAARVPIS